MLDRVCFFNNNIFVFQPDAYLVSFKYPKTGNHLQNFKDCTKISIPVSNDFRVKDLFFNVIENYSVGLKCISIVAVSDTNNISLFMYSDTLSRHVFSFKNTKLLSKPSSEPKKNLFMTHGPTFVYFHNNLLEIYSPVHNTQHSLDLLTVFTDTKGSFQLLQVTAIGQLLDSDPVTVLLICLSYETIEEKKVCLLSLSVNTKLNNSRVIHKKLPTSHFYSKCFGNFIKSINVGNVTVSQNAINWKENSCCIVTNEECLVFNNGILKCVARLPFCNVLHVRTEFCDFKTANIKLILVSDNEEVHLLTKDDCSDLQV